MNPIESTLSKYVFGSVKQKPIANLPEGAEVHVRIRRSRPALAMIQKPGEQLRQYLLVDRGDHWELGPGFTPKQKEARHGAR